VSSAKPAVVRFYFDADVLGLARIVAGLRNDATFPGDPGATINRRQRSACPITDRSTKDPVWIEKVAALGWLIVTRDSRIQQHRAEIAAVRESGARMVALAGNDARGTWEQLEVFMRQWREIDRLTATDGPFIYTATRTSLRSIPLG
jgi:hypothetical protein